MSSTRAIMMKPSDISLLIDTIMAGVPRDPKGQALNGLLVQPYEDPDGSSGVEIHDPSQSKSVHYLVTPKGIKGPNPEDYEKDTRSVLGAVVSNVADFLAALQRFEYNTSTQFYQEVTSP